MGNLNSRNRSLSKFVKIKILGVLEMRPNASRTWENVVDFCEILINKTCYFRVVTGPVGSWIKAVGSGMTASGI